MNDEPESQSDREARGEGGEGIEWQWVFAGVGLIALIVVVLLLLGVGRGGENQDRLTDAAFEDGARFTPEQQCASQSVHDRIKRELFRRAVQVRGSDQEAFDSVAGHASVRMEAPMATDFDEDAGTVSCTGLLWLDLPPGVVIPGGRRTISADVVYTIAVDSDGEGTLTGLGNADAIVTPLATLARVREPEDEPPLVVEPSMDSILIPSPDGVQPPPQQQPQQPQVSGPSFDCRMAETASEVAVCNDAVLAALDRQMAALYGSALGGADSQQRALLVRTRDRFLAYRAGCRTNSCIASAYQGRMREIRDIMAGQWQGRR